MGKEFKVGDEVLIKATLEKNDNQNYPLCINIDNNNFTFTEDGKINKRNVEPILHHIEELYQPKPRKVRAYYDDGVSFETYLLAEIKKSEYPFIVVHENWVNEYKSGVDFRTFNIKKIKFINESNNDKIEELQNKINELQKELNKLK